MKDIKQKPLSNEKLGLKKGTVTISEYTSDWQLRFKEEKGRLEDALGNLALETHHIGSTSVPQLDSKPVIDMVIVIADSQDITEFIPILEKLGYMYHKERRNSQEHFFELGDKATTYQVYLIPKSNYKWKRLIKFRDILINNPTKRVEYQTLKKTLADRFANDPRAYATNKFDFIENMINEN